MTNELQNPIVGCKYVLIPTWGTIGDKFVAEYRGKSDYDKGCFWTGKSQIVMPLSCIYAVDGKWTEFEKAK